MESGHYAMLGMFDDSGIMGHDHLEEWVSVDGLETRAEAVYWAQSILVTKGFMRPDEEVA